MCVRLATSNSCSHQLIMSKTQSYSSPALVPNHPLGSNSSQHPHHFALINASVNILCCCPPHFIYYISIHYLHSQLNSSLKEEIPMSCCCFFNWIFIKQGMCRFTVQNRCRSIQILTEHFSKWQPLVTKQGHTMSTEYEEEDQV